MTFSAKLQRVGLGLRPTVLNYLHCSLDNFFLVKIASMTYCRKKRMSKQIVLKKAGQVRIELAWRGFRTVLAQNLNLVGKTVFLIRGRMKLTRGMGTPITYCFSRDCFSILHP